MHCNVNTCTVKLVLFELMYVQPLDIWIQLARSIISLLKDLMMKPDIKSLDIFNEKVGFTIFDSPQLDFGLSQREGEVLLKNCPMPL